MKELNAWIVTALIICMLVLSMVGIGLNAAAQAQPSSATNGIVTGVTTTQAMQDLVQRAAQ